MAFKPVLDLNADVTVAIGGTDKRTNKKNPTSVEGYYLGRRQIEDRKKKSGVSYIYIFQTSNGNLGVWGKTDLDRKMGTLTPGIMTRVTFAGMRPTPNGDMYTYTVESDADNTIDVSTLTGNNKASAYTEESLYEYTAEAVEEETEELNDEPVAAAPNAPTAPAKAADAARQARVKALLEGNRKSA